MLPTYMANPICLPYYELGNDEHKFSVIEAAGYGITGFGQSNYLRFAQMKEVEYWTCLKKMHQTFVNYYENETLPDPMINGHMTCWESYFGG